jgi:hypothetical protein
MAALSAIRCNPAARALYARVVAKHPTHKAVAVGHVMRKLLHLVFALWKSGKPFDPNHYAWAPPAAAAAAPSDNALSPEAETDNALSANEQAAGHKPDTKPAEQVVTAACVPTVAQSETGAESLATVQSLSCAAYAACLAFFLPEPL